MYNTKFVCTYNSDEIFKGLENIDIMTKKDKEFFQDAYYRYELLSIFGLEDYNEREISEAVAVLYEKVKDSKELKECMLKLAANFMSLDEELGLMMLFAYDYLYLSHICISEFLETGKITDDNIVRLKSLIYLK
jgi:hypothetical protein